MSILTVARFNIQAGKIDEFKRIAESCMAAVREKDKGVLRYDFYFNDDQSECVVVEEYPDGAAVLNHIAIAGPFLGELTKVASAKLQAFGTIPPELEPLIARMGVDVYSPYMKLSR